MDDKTGCSDAGGDEYGHATTNPIPQGYHGKGADEAAECVDGDDGSCCFVSGVVNGFRCGLPCAVALWSRTAPVVVLVLMAGKYLTKER